MTIATQPARSTRPLVPMREELEALRAQLTGQLITAEHPDFDAARKLRFIDIDRRPRAIVRAANTQDVAATVRFAGDHNLSLTVRSGGHSLAYHSVIDDAVVVDLSGMKRISIDPERRTARVQAGATSGDLASAAHAYGLALSTGDTHSVGMGGLTTGGGIGLMVRKYGLAIDNLLKAQVVTADGTIVTASPDEHPDLFWAIRGGGGNFGVVTEFTYRLAPVEQILGGYLFLPASREVIRGYLEYAIAAPDELTTIADLMHAPPAPFMPEERVGELVLAILVCWTGNEIDGERALAPLRALATPVAEAVAIMPYPTIYELTAEAAGPHGKAIRSMFADQLSDTALDAALTAMKQASSPYSVIEFRALGGAMARVGNDATAFAHRERRYFFAIIGLWFDPAEDPVRHSAWTEALWQVIRPEGAGVYVNFLENEGPGRVRDAYPPATFARLAAIKQRYDPQNMFRFNQNIPPQANA
jgi:FAD/FMN-containing dehydrogenase